jgi:hypothetical protein
VFLSLHHSRCSSISAVGDVAALPDDYTQNITSGSGYPNSAVGIPSHEDNQSQMVNKMNQKPWYSNKMVKICDKLIGVFMVDKPTPTDWRKLIAFSREWDNIRPHFFKRCQERADAEPNPEMKHNLLRLARKLKEVSKHCFHFFFAVAFPSWFAWLPNLLIVIINRVCLLFQIDEDVQRHNELLEVVKSIPSDKLGAIVAKRRKDFTVEFFNHLYYVAESYHDDTEKQNGESYMYSSVVLTDFLTFVSCIVYFSLYG